jgi:hypothetical protein
MSEHPNRVAKLLADRPDMTGADIGRELGVSPRHGLRLKRAAEWGQTAGQPCSEG